VVVEARERSGALITVDFALEQGRDVLVVPGEITSALSAGVNALLRHGAAPVLRVDDILEAIGVVAAAPMLSQPAGPAARVLAAVRETPATADEIARIVALPAAEVAALLTELELDGLVEPGEGAYRATIAR
jgi:DNA processing protein